MFCSPQARKQLVAALLVFSSGLLLGAAGQTEAPSLTGFVNSGAEWQLERQFLAVPDPRLAAHHLQTLTAAPHMAGSPEDRQTADYVAQQFRAAGLETEIVTYRVWMNYPAEISVDVVAPPEAKMHGPTREHVEGDDPYQNDPRIVTPFSGSSPSGDVEAEVVYANYGRPEDLRKLQEMGIEVRGKILLMRYGQNYRGVKSFVAQKSGAVGALLYSDPVDDGWVRGDPYPLGPWRPDTAVQRGSVGYLFEFPGDPTTPGIASTTDLPAEQRTPPQQSAELPTVPTTPLSSHDAWPILEYLGGPDSPREWQGALPFTYHLGPGPVRVRLHLKQDYAYRDIWDVMGRVRGRQAPDEWVVAGNHRDAWVYGAVDPGSGTAALLEAVHGIGALLKSGWRPRRTLVFGSWDAEEEGLVGSTEWAEQNAGPLAHAVAYMNIDVAVSGPNFGASAVPSLRPFLREAAKAVPSAQGGTVYEKWGSGRRNRDAAHMPPEATRAPARAAPSDEPAVGDLGSGSDFAVFLQHLGVPSLDIGSWGPYGVYHSAFDDFTWFKRFADPQFVYEQQQARLFGLAILRLANADILPFDYEEYGRQVRVYLEAAEKKAEARFGNAAPKFAGALSASDRLRAAGAAIKEAEKRPNPNLARLNAALREAERGFLLPEGLPHRPWFRHAIYAPGEYTGYEAVMLPGVDDAVSAGDLPLATEQLQKVTAAIERVAQTLEEGAKAR
jgi:N-acetylated-alpha-linked acidic dipeptidase